MRYREIMEARKRRVTPAESYIAAVKAQGRCSSCWLKPRHDDPNTVHLLWLESDGQPLVPFLTSLADRLGIKLILSVDVSDTEFGGKLVGYYQKHGFEIANSDFDDDFDFLNMEPSDQLQGQVYMERTPQIKEALCEARTSTRAMLIPWNLSHG